MLTGGLSSNFRIGIDVSLGTVPLTVWRVLPQFTYSIGVTSYFKKLVCRFLTEHCGRGVSGSEVIVCTAHMGAPLSA